MLTVTQDHKIQCDDVTMSLQEFGDYKLVRTQPVLKHAMEMHSAFRVIDRKGNVSEGDPGDMLIVGLNNELYICERAVFDRTYKVI